MSIENIFLSIILSTIISLIFSMLIAAIAAPFRHKLKKENVINVESKINNNSNIKWLIIHFSCICIFIVYYLPALFYCFYKSVDCIILKILLLLFNVVSIYVVMWIMDSSLFKSKEKVLDTNIKNLIYLLTLIVAFITLVIFGLLNFGDLINEDEDTDDFLEYMIAPLCALIGNIIPLKSVYSVKGAKKEIYENIKGEYFIEKKEDKKRTYRITLSINTIIALFFIFDKLIYIWDSDIEATYNILFRLTDVSEAQKQAHIDNINMKYHKRHTNTQPVNAAPPIPQQNIPPVVQPTSSPQVNTVPHCPKCGSPLVLRTAKRGDKAGNQFYGCSNFPKCRYIQNL